MALADRQRRSVIVLPPFETTEEAAEISGKLSWYTAPYAGRIAAIRCFGTVADAGDFARLSHAHVFDRHIPDLLESFVPKVECLPASGIKDRDIWAEEGDGVIVWNARRFHGLLADCPELRRHLRGRPMVLIDRKANPFESFQLPYFLHRLFGTGRIDDEAAAFQRFLEEAGRRPDPDLCNVYGGGCSVLELRHFPPGGAVLCNAMVAYPELTQRLSPVAVALYDPLLAGCSRYGALFREELARFFIDSPAWVVTLDLYAPYYRAVLPAPARERVIGVPAEFGDFPPRRTHLDLAREFRCVDAWNVITTLSIPLATTLADNIGLLGLDGVDPSAPGVYDSIKIDDDCDSILRVHGRLPGGGDADYDRKHAQTLDATISAALASGKTFRVHTPSHYPILQRLVAAVAS